MKLIPILGGAILVLLPMGGIAQEQTACPLNYEAFEVGVPHTDMETCPGTMDTGDTYCRLSLVAEVATVFAFSTETDCIVSTSVFYEESFELRFN